jgi:hypothetical protein
MDFIASSPFLPLVHMALGTGDFVGTGETAATGRMRRYKRNPAGPSINVRKSTGAISQELICRS